MNTSPSILIGLGVVDVLIVAMLCLFLWTQSHVVNRKTRVITALALSGFIVHAIIFFDGAILYLQLATIAIIYILVAFWPPKKQGTDVISG